jgi:hypothetical protein
MKLLVFFFGREPAESAKRNPFTLCVGPVDRAPRRQTAAHAAAGLNGLTRAELQPR